MVSGPRVKLVGCKRALNSTTVYSTDRSKAVIPVLVISFLLCGLFLRGVLSLALSVCFSVLLALRLPRLGKRELILVFFRTFVQFALVLLCLLSLPLVWEGLRLVTMAFPGLFSYLFCKEPDFERWVGVHRSTPRTRISLLNEESVTGSHCGMTKVLLIQL